MQGLSWFLLAGLDALQDFTFFLAIVLFRNHITFQYVCAFSKDKDSSTEMGGYWLEVCATEQMVSCNASRVNLATVLKGTLASAVGNPFMGPGLTQFSLCVR